MTDARTTQVAIEQWGGGASARLTQIGLEQWVSVATGPSVAAMTQIGLEQWASSPPPPAGGIFVCGISERWDYGLWDAAHWDGQLGICPAVGSIVVTGFPAWATGSSGLGHILSAATAAIHVNGVPCGLHLMSARSFPAELGTIIVNGPDINLTRGYTMDCTTNAPSQIVVSGNWANLILYQQPGQLNFGIPAVKLTRW